MNRMEKILRPRSIAVIGASRKEGSLGSMFLQAVLNMNFTGEIYPINPKADEILGIKTYPNLKALPSKPDLAVILLSYNYVLDSFKDVAEAGIRDVIVISAGFKEIGGEGIDREQKLMELAKQYGMNLLGPNCMGVFNTDAAVSFNGTFSPTLPNPGHVAYVSQSGALGVAILELAAQTDLGFSVFVSTGNKADISDSDILEFLYEDSNTNVITMYLESISKPDQFRKISSKIAAVKPVLAIKAGRTESGLRAASSHTGALANPEYIMDGYLKQCGIIRKDNLEELFDAARALAAQPLPEGPRVAVVTNAGGPAILASDAVDRFGLRLAELNPVTVKKLQQILPEEASAANPVDMIASANHATYREVMETVLADPNVDSVILIIVKPPVATSAKKIIENMDAVVHNCSKTIIPVLMAQRDADAGLKKFKELHLPLFSYPEAAVKALATMWQYQQIQQRFRKSEAVVVTPRTEEALEAGSGTENKQAPLENLEDLLRQYDIKTVPSLISESLDDILRFYREADTIVLKIANEQIIHKTEAGLVMLNLDSESAVREAYKTIHEKALRLLPRAATPRFLAQKQLSRGIELVLGGKRDELFGPVIMAGIGGIFIEVLKDVSFRIAPVNAYEAREMIAELRSQALLNGFRGNPAVDRDSFAYTIQRFSLLFAEHPEIAEMDLNPLIWSPAQQALVAVDVRATIKS